MSELLSIAIPTYNRATYLKELLHILKEQINLLENADTIKIYIFDNNSQDDTQNVVLDTHLDVFYKKNETNIFGDPNIYQAYTIPQGEYIWVIGDDDLITNDALSSILSIIKTKHPGLIILSDANYHLFTRSPELFNSYSDFVCFFSKKNPHFLLAHSLISANVVRRDLFDSDYARSMLNTHYGHFYGILNKMNSSQTLILPKKKLLSIRNNRPAFSDPISFQEVYNSQIDFLFWLKQKYSLCIDVPSVVPNYMFRVKVFLLVTTPLRIISRFKKLLW